VSYLYKLFNMRSSVRKRQVSSFLNFLFDILQVRGRKYSANIICASVQCGFWTVVFNTQLTWRIWNISPRKAVGIEASVFSVYDSWAGSYKYRSLFSSGILLLLAVMSQADYTNGWSDRRANGRTLRTVVTPQNTVTWKTNNTALS
jgi:hypothetical protein